MLYLTPKRCSRRELPSLSRAAAAAATVLRVGGKGQHPGRLGVQWPVAVVQPVGHVVLGPCPGLPAANASESCATQSSSSASSRRLCRMRPAAPRF